MKKIYLTCLVVLIAVIGFFFLNSLGIAGVHDNFDTVVTWTDYDKQIAEEVVFDYTLMDSTKLEYNLVVSDDKDILDIELNIIELSSPIIFQIVSEEGLIKKIELSNNNQDQISLSQGDYKVNLIFNSGEGHGTVKWKLS